MAIEDYAEWSGQIRITGLPIKVHRLPDGTRVIDANDRATLLQLWRNSSFRLTESEWDTLFRFGSRTDARAAV
jgi:hypothetical protein